VLSFLGDHQSAPTTTELLFLALFLRLLKIGGRAAVIVPDGVLFGSSKAHKDLRRLLVEENKLEAVIKLPSGVFRPYAGVSTAILVFTAPASVAQIMCGSTTCALTAGRLTTNANRCCPTTSSGRRPRRR
jgi:type I restriction-modification system DNA methylase subunit